MDKMILVADGESRKNGFSFTRAISWNFVRRRLSYPFPVWKAPQDWNMMTWSTH